MGEFLSMDVSKIEILVLDVDGVLTDGTLIINSDGSETKRFNALDGHGIRLWKRAGNKVAFLSGRHSDPTEVRARQLDIDYCFQDCHVKLPVLNALAVEVGIGLENIAYMGDDLPDVPILREVGFAISVPNGTAEARDAADYVTEKKGGSGAVREVIELMLKEKGQWEELMGRYLR